MALDTVKLLDGAETEALRRKNEALAEARKVIAQAREDGETRLLRTKEEAQKEAQKFLKEQADQEKSEAQSAHLQSRRACNAMKAEAEGRLDSAAELIVERIVGS